MLNGGGRKSVETLVLSLFVLPHPPVPVISNN